MHIKKTAIAVAFGAVFGVTTMTAHAATVSNGDQLTIMNGVQQVDANNNPVNVTVGSWFAMDLSGDSKIQGTEKTPITMGSQGIIIGANQTPGQIDTWTFNAATGMDHTPTVAITGSTETGLNMSGWTVNWNGGDIPMPSGAWNPGNCATVGVSCANANGIGTFTWNGLDGGSYVLDYAATVPPPSGFAGTKYYLHLVGTVQLAPTAPIPVPAAVWLLGSGLLGLVGVARRKKA